MMVKILLYGYATGIRSSRKIAKKLQEDVAFRVLAAGNFPAHRTIAEFRQLHLKEFEALFVQAVQLAQEIGLLKLGTLAIDGSKVEANASKHKAMSYGRMKEEEQRLGEEIRKLLEQAAAVDAEE
ncbi:MAG: transposase [Acidobacteria bacterium]|nr:transposase [Acidobacteriota bacterium]